MESSFIRKPDFYIWKPDVSAKRMDNDRIETYEIVIT